MGVVAGIVLLVAAVAVYSMYINWLRRGIRGREFLSNLSADQLRRLFTEKVAGMGWKVVDFDNPMVAQSPLLAGLRQQISLKMTPEGGRIRCVIAPTRVWTKGLARVPYKAHTLRMRLNAFEHAASAGPAPAGAHTGAGQPVPQLPMARPAAAPPPVMQTPALPPPAPAGPAAPPPEVLQPRVQPAAAPVARPQVAGQWAADPFGRHELRYHDGTRWTESVSDRGVQGTDPAEWRGPTPASSPTPASTPTPTPPPSPLPLRTDTPTPLPTAAGIDDHDGRTMTRMQFDELRQRSTTPPVPTVRPVTIRFDTGTTLTISGPTVIGRNPSAPTGSGPCALHAINDPDMSVSKTHLWIAVESGRLVVEDLGSSNGSVVVSANGARQRLVAGTRTTVPDGASVVIGDRTFRMM